MSSVFGLGIAREEFFLQLPQSLPEEIAFFEVPGEMLEQSASPAKLKKFCRKQNKAVVIRNLMPTYLADLVPESPLRLKVEFDSMFRARCKAAAELGCRIFTIDFNISRALEDAGYSAKLVSLLLSMAGVLEEHKLLMALPLCLPVDGAQGTVSSSFLAFKHRLFYPGFRFCIDFHYEEPGAFEILDKELEILRFDHKFWRLAYQPDSENILTCGVLERLRPAFRNENNTPAFVCIDPGVTPPDHKMLYELSGLIKEFSSSKEVNG